MEEVLPATLKLVLILQSLLTKKCKNDNFLICQKEVMSNVDIVSLGQNYSLLKSFCLQLHLPKIEVNLRDRKLMFVSCRAYSMLSDIVRKWSRSILTYVPRMDTSALCCRSWEPGDS